MNIVEQAALIVASTNLKMDELAPVDRTFDEVLGVILDSFYQVRGQEIDEQDTLNGIGGVAWL